MSRTHPILSLKGPWHFVVLALIFFLAAAYRIYGLDLESVWFDECFSIYQLYEDSLSEALTLFQEGNPQVQPLYAIALYFYAKVAGNSVLALRYFSAALGFLAVIQIYFLGRTTYDRTAGLVAAALMGLTLNMLYYSQEIRMYTMLLVFGIASAHIFIIMLRGGGWGWWAVSTLLTGILVWTHAASVLVLMPQFFIVATSSKFSWPRKTIWCVMHAVAVATLIFWWMNVDHETIARVTNDQPPPRWTTFSGMPIHHTFTGFFWGWSGSYTAPQEAPWLNMFVEPIYRFALIATPLITATILLGGRFMKRRDNTEEDAPNTYLVPFLSIWMLGPPLFLFLIARYGGLDFFTRYAMHCAVPSYILTGIAVTRFARPNWHLPIVATFIVLSLVRHTGFEQPWRTPWRDAVYWVEANESPEVPVLAYQPSPSPPPLHHTSYEFYASNKDQAFDYAFGKAKLQAALDDVTKNYPVIFATGADADGLAAHLDSLGRGYERHRLPGLKPFTVHVFDLEPR